MGIPRSDIKNIIIIILILLCVNLGVYIYIHRDSQTSGDHIAAKADSASHSAHIPATSENSNMSAFPFDPNTADSATFVRLGLAPRVARAIIHYRQAGGVFRKADDFSRIYTLKPADYQRLKPYIRINELYSTPTVKQKHENSDFAEQPGYAPTNNKLRAGQTIDISTADTTMLMRIPGIGPYYAKKIIRYRERLGGFVSTAQLREIQGLPDDIEQWTTVDTQKQTAPTNPIKRLAVNRMTFSQLLAHPYLDYNQVKAIVNHRQHYGNLRSLDDLTNYDAFTAEDIKRLKPYLDFSL